MNFSFLKCFLLIIFLPSFVFAENLTLTTYYPSPFGVYDQLRLFPRAPLGTPCKIGTLYVASPDNIQFCRDNGTRTGIWGYIPGIWTQFNDDIYLSDTLTSPNLAVGIGTTTPNSRLTIKGAGTTDATSSLNVTNNTGASALFVSDNGNVGIRTTIPQTELDVLSDDSIAAIRIAENNSSNSIWELRAHEILGAPPGALPSFSIYGGEPGSLRERLVINSDGWVGIGKTVPEYGLDVWGYNARIGGGDGEFIFAGDALISPNETIRMETNGETRLMVTVDGDVGIGTANPRAPFDVSSNYVRFENPDGPLFFRLGATEDNVASMGFYEQGSGPMASIGYKPAYSALMIEAPGNRHVIINTNTGSLGIGNNFPSHPLHMASGAHVTNGGVWTDASSIEYKQDVAELTTPVAYETLKKLNPVTFRFKIDPEEKHAGFIAEDVPDLVATKDRKGLSPMDIVAILTKVVQDQQKAIQDQQKAIQGQQTIVQNQQRTLKQQQKEIEQLKIQFNSM